MKTISNSIPFFDKKLDSIEGKKLSPEEAREAALKFEKTFISTCLQNLLTSACQGKGLLGGGETETMFRSIFTEKLADSLVGKFGLADSVYKHLLQNQEIADDSKLSQPSVGS